MKDWILNQEDYVTNESGSFKYKYRLLKRTAKCTFSDMFHFTGNDADNTV